MPVSSSILYTVSWGQKVGTDTYLKNRYLSLLFTTFILYLEAFLYKPFDALFVSLFVKHFYPSCFVFSTVQTQFPGGLLHTLYGFFNHRIKFHPQQGGAFLNHLAVDAGCKILLLPLLFDRFYL